MISKKPKQGYKLVTDFFKHVFEIPENWTYPKFNEVVKTNSLTKIDEEAVPYIPMDAVDISKPHFNYFKERILSENSSLPKFQENDVLFARITPSTENGKTCIVENFPRKGIASSELTVLRPTKSVFPKYLYYYVKNYRLRQFAISQMMGTTGRQRVPDYVFKKDLYFELPSFPEQQKNASILSDVDNLINSYDKIIESTKKLKKGLMQQLFTKGIGHKKFKDSEIGKIPEAWEAKPLEKVLTIIQYGLSKPLSAVGKYPIFRMNSIQKGEVLERDMKFIDLEYDEFKKYKLEKNDLLFNRTNSYDLVGKIGIFLLEGDYTFAGYLIRLRTNEKMNTVFLNNYLNTKQSQYRVKRFATPGVSQTNINATNLKSVIIPVPPREEQDKIASILDKFDFSIIELKSKKTSLESLKKGLMQKLLTGQIRVKV